MGTTPFFPADCPSRTVLEVLANKWSLYVLAALRGGPRRFNELRRILDGVTQKMLTQTLRALERDGLIRRGVYPTVPLRVEYSLTELGVGAGNLTSAIGDWSKRHARDRRCPRRVRPARRRRTAPRPEPLTGNRGHAALTRRREFYFARGHLRATTQPGSPQHGDTAVSAGGRTASGAAHNEAT